MNTKELIFTILDQPVPQDMTLAELIEYTPTLDMWKQIPEIDPNTVEVRFVDRDGKDYPGSMTIGDFNKIADARMNISIRRGGVGALQTEDA